MPAVAGVAQLVEQWFCKPQVGGSTPSAGTNRVGEGDQPGPTDTEEFQALPTATLSPRLVLAGSVWAAVGHKAVTDGSALSALQHSPSGPSCRRQTKEDYDTGTNQKGRLTGLNNSGANTTWTYNTKGRVHSKTQVSNGNTKTISYQYNAAGQLSQITTPSNKVIVYGYTNGKVSSITVGSTTLLNNVVYESFGPVGGWTWGNGTLAVRTYDLDGRVHQVDSGGLRTYSWDDAGRITAVVDAQNGSLNQSYGYDSLDRLTGVTKSSGNQSFTYDGNGNRLTYGNGGANSTYTIAGTSNRLSIITGSQARTYSYNAVGAVTGDGSKTFAFSDRERMKSATVSGSTWNYYHNGFGERVRKKLAPSGNHYYVYDEAGHLVGEYNGNTLIQETVWLGDIPVATLRGSSIYYVHTDHLNAPKKVTQTNNGVRWTWDRDPFGTTTVNENPAGLGTFSYNLRLPGQFYDTETGLSYNYFRDYDPAVGRYVQSDPVGLRGGLNTYGYATANPVMRFDTTGLTSISVDISNGLMLVYPEVKGRWPYSMPVKSGINECTNNPKCSDSKNRGPIPAGDYVVKAAELSDPGVIHDVLRQFRGDWGDWRAPAHPLPNTNTHGRSGFFLHGGSLDGSLGCIDFGGGRFGNTLTDQLRKDILSDPDGVIPVTVH